MSTAAYAVAKDQYASLGIDTDAAIERLLAIPISIHCWQGDDVVGFESSGQSLGGGLAVTGNYPGRARTTDELRADFQTAVDLLPGTHRINLHAIYGDFDGRKVDRDAVDTVHFDRWIAWARTLGLGIDFNPTCFAHPKASSGLTLSSPDAAVRSFWVEHCRRSRRIAADIGKALGQICVNNVWVPDGMKDTPVDRKGARERLGDSLDKVFADAIDPSFMLDAVEGKLFGIGSESFVVGSHEYYLGYAIRHGKLLTLDAGHYHPTESMADKITSVLAWLPEVLLHVSRGVRWDSDHVVTLDDALRSIAEEIVRGDFLGRVRIGLDYFDASINRVAAWVIGVRATQRALLLALLEPTPTLRRYELDGDYTARLALLEELKSLPAGAVYDEACSRSNVPAGLGWLDAVKQYERDVLSRR